VHNNDINLNSNDKSTEPEMIVQAIGVHSDVFGHLQDRPKQNTIVRCL